jgi:predicted N-formylglutamate amidohydrolase
MRQEAEADAAGALLSPVDPAPFTILNPEALAPIMLVCDHASNAIPAVLGGLGLTQSEAKLHIAWDIGAAAVTAALAARLGATALSSGFSRLVVDCNRRLDDPTAIPEISDGIVVPGNRALTPLHRAARAAACYHPYHAAIAARLAGFAAAGVVPAVIAIHSFTPVMQGFQRPWQAGVLWDRDDRIAAPLLQALAAPGDLTVGDNLPYSGRDPEGYTLEHHAIPHGLPHVMLELRQNEIDTPAGAERMALRLEAALRPILADPALYRAQFFP